MSVRLSLTTAVDPSGSSIASRTAGDGVQELNSLALRGLVSLFDSKRKLFSDRVTSTKGRLSREGISYRGTLIALLGLKRIAETGVTLPFDVASIQDLILENTSWVRCAGDLGLLTWFTAICVPERVGMLFNNFDFERALETYPDGRRASTSGLAWFLTGIAHARLAHCGTLPDLTEVAVDTYHLLRDNQSDSGIFGHAALPGFSRGMLYSRLGTFSDQIYAIYALSMFARAFQIVEPLESALGCADAVCALQGEMGQWWSLYDKRAARIVNRYPVFSAHQDGTAPFALFALEDATGRNFQKSIFKGLSWITGANELENDLRDRDRAFIWDSIGPKSRIRKYLDAALGLLFPRREAPVRGLGIQYEARADHLGWLLYAFGRYGLPNS